MKKEVKIMIGKVILNTIATAGVLAVAVIAPNTLQAIDFLYSKEKRHYHRGYYVKKAINKLNERGLIEFEKSGDKTFVRLSEKGERELLKYHLREAVIEKPKKWDKKWRVVIFDIKERRKIIREELRKELINLGFRRLQNSVWIYPYECEELIIMLKSYFSIGKDVLYMVVERLENDKWLKRDFGLEN
ncbi:MAG: CRISPR-associated endonuclease Cas2 [Candidatus Tagabacteria bacterium CG_4_10_14_0_2_um_filter_40_13]|uniref:CRISPR-associated endonuclease Cas2 n=3 Tax=Candidatus Tagaibacteriota TaxID=1817918 RepID=A0A2M8G8K7_9BACT|nr:MAG: CRISPR-associated endonuclease Cas2 [Candidatus Tagabacteria bacterium CG03_land_8_20_14_0_80_41_22]PIZ55976.1 MAG: CRISPR-associated endonuclease Cas2 [Candidatus Tagabacteria bacterium CG_4_10_14_0_2_um_filter_40_13]PJC25012.1 MAG: CRISPR-associated endonuclease Cas2 [Candidatus Tagabacteria bacterium CG_4_9_14_0_2_um_filter_41_11]PJC69686.1 MAG: CRISPR-associated endonuclease Cas2 [Candidatus Tagabacteria bacterium CG_4_8_14_3_um_filter_41_8]